VWWQIYSMEDNLAGLVNDLDKLYKKSTVCTDNKEKALFICAQMKDRYSKVVGYPKLYLMAWDVLIESLRPTPINYDRLTSIREVGDAYYAPLHWHLKAVLYCWVGGVDHKPLLELLSSSGIFVNMTPDDAKLAILEKRFMLGSEIKPFLLRISLSYPGSIIISFLSLKSNDYVVHLRLDDPTGVVIEGDIYQYLWSNLTGGQADITKEQASICLLRLCPDSDPLDINTSLSPLYHNFRRRGSSEVYKYIMEVMFGGTVSIHIPSSSTLGTMVLEWPTKSTCFQCNGANVSVRGPIGSNIYCNDQCYRKDWAKCY
jgi:hypothetical protein